MSFEHWNKFVLDTISKAEKEKTKKNPATINAEKLRKTDNSGEHLAEIKK